MNRMGSCCEKKKLWVFLVFYVNPCVAAPTAEARRPIAGPIAGAIAGPIAGARTRGSDEGLGRGARTRGPNAPAGHTLVLI